MAGQTLSYAQRYNPLRLQSDTRDWRDLNGDDVAQENEIGPSNNLAFGLPVFATRPGPDGLDREYDIETSLAVQHELARGLSVSGSWFRRSTNNQRRTDNLLVSHADYFPVNIINPLDGTPLTVYNLDPNKRGQLDQIDCNSTDSDTRSRVYNGYELGLAGRLHGASFFGGWTFDRLVSAQCDCGRQPELLPELRGRSTNVVHAELAGATSGRSTSRPTRLQAVRLVHVPVRHPGQRGVAELRRAHRAAPTGTSPRRRPTRRLRRLPCRASWSFRIS